MPFLPLKDDNPLKVIWFQVVKVSIIALCAVVFLWQLSSGAAGSACQPTPPRDVATI